MPLILIVGQRGSGKTLLIVKLMKNVKRPIYSNFEIKHKYYRKLKIIDFLDMKPNCEILLDEGYTWVESRSSMKYQNLFASYIVFQLRKTNRNIYVTVQDISTIDIRYRKQWDYLIQCKRVTNSKIEEKEWDFKYKIYDKKKQSSKQLVLPYSKAKGLFDLYDTNEIVPVSSKSRIEYEILKTEPMEFFARSLEIYNKLKGNLNPGVTKEFVKFLLLRHGMDEIWSNIIYLLAKNKK